MSGVFRMSREPLPWLGWKKEIKNSLQALVLTLVFMSPLGYAIRDAHWEDLHNLEQHLQHHPQRPCGMQHLYRTQ